MPISATAFETWWRSPGNPAQFMLESTQNQIKGHMKLAFYAGRDHAKSCIVRDAKRTRDKIPVFSFDEPSSPPSASQASG